MHSVLASLSWLFFIYCFKLIWKTDDQCWFDTRCVTILLHKILTICEGQGPWELLLPHGELLNWTHFPITSEVQVPSHLPCSFPGHVTRRQSQQLEEERFFLHSISLIQDSLCIRFLWCCNEVPQTEWLQMREMCCLSSRHKSAKLKYW